MLSRLLTLSRPSLLLRHLLPSSCALCGQTDQETLCQSCRQRYFALRPRRCVQCALAIPTVAREIRCGDCLRNKPAFDATIVVTDYAAPADQLVLALKFGGALPLAPLMADMLCEAVRYAVQRGLPLPTALSAVPLGTGRLRERGFNQSLEIARSLARRLDLPLAPELLLRQRDTQQQAMLPHEGRRRNVQRAFVVPMHSMDHVRGAHIGVVDDVITTGETLNEIAATLKRFGARRVTNLVFSRTPAK